MIWQQKNCLLDVVKLKRFTDTKIFSRDLKSLLIAQVYLVVILVDFQKML